MIAQLKQYLACFVYLVNLNILQGQMSDDINHLQFMIGLESSRVEYWIAQTTRVLKEEVERRVKAEQTLAALKLPKH